MDNNDEDKTVEQVVEETPEVVDFDLNIHVARLLMNEPFFAALSRRVDKRPTQGIPTAGVLVNPHTAQFEMLYNPNFFAKMSDAERRDIIKHELYHIIFEHLTGRRPEGESNRLWNFATDLAINSHLPNLPKGCLKPGFDEFKDFPAGQSAEWYMEKLKQKMKDQKEEGDGNGEGQPGEGDRQGATKRKPPQSCRRGQSK
jgi:predicted metal-dependent peptidase